MSEPVDFAGGLVDSVDWVCVWVGVGGGAGVVVGGAGNVGTSAAAGAVSVGAGSCAALGRTPVLNAAPSAPASARAKMVDRRLTV